MGWYNHHHYLDSESSHHPQCKSIYIKQSLPTVIPSPVPGNHSFIFFGYGVAYYGNFPQIENVILTSNLD